MNILHEKQISKFLKKLNTIDSRKKLGEEIVNRLPKILHIQYCHIYMTDLATNKVLFTKFVSSKTLNNNLQKRALEIEELGSDLFKNMYDSRDILDFFCKMSKDNVIIAPIMSKQDIIGYITLISNRQDFNLKESDTVNIIMENFNTRLEVILLREIIERANRDKIHFLSSIAHEYKTPLNSIIGFSDILKLNLKNDPNYKYADNISKSSNFLLTLIKDILEVANGEFGEIQLYYSSIRTKELIEDIITGFDDVVKQKNIHISYTITDMEISADEKRLKQVIYNLISNAIKFNKPNGTITIVTYIDEMQNFNFEIKDSGEGIRKNDYDRIFNFFNQINRNQLKRQQGSGIGLALSKMIVEAHNGKIGFHSRLHSGSTFWFKIPIHN